MENETLKTELSHLNRRLENLEHTLYGNGSKGIKAELIILKTEIHAFKRMAIWQIGIGVAILCTLLSKWL